MCPSNGILVIPALRRRKVRISALDDIGGIGPKKKANLIRHFGSLEKIKYADIEELQKVGFINEKEAKAIYDHFRC